MPEFSGAVALVTGGARGLGQAICEKLSAYGASVAVTDADLAGATRASDQLVAAGRTARAYELDVTSAEDARRAVAAVEEELGPIAVLVNNAGISRRAEFLDLSESEWERTLSVNLTGVFNTCRAVLPGMAQRRSGSVVNISSILGKMGEAGFAHYSASKFGVIGLTQAIAAEMAPLGVTANTVLPGIVETPMWDALYEDAVAQSDLFSSEDDVRAFVLSRIPLGRTQAPEDIAEMVAFLASDLGRNMTGGSYHVDGGMVPR